MPCSRELFSGEASSECELANALTEYALSTIWPHKLIDFGLASVPTFLHFWEVKPMELLGLFVLNSSVWASGHGSTSLCQSSDFCSACSESSCSANFTNCSVFGGLYLDGQRYVF